VEVTVSTPDGVTRERYEAAAVHAAVARVARIASETRLAATAGPAGFVPLAAARVPAYGG
jgi:hypothetical protein